MAERIEEVAFEVGAERCAGWLHLPAGAGPHPSVVMLHSTAGVRQLRCYAERGEAFAAAGIATLQFDCRGFGASDGEPRQLFDVKRQAGDLAAALGFARSRADLDRGRIALRGGSASCAQVLALAALDPAVRAVVCLTPFIPGRDTQRSAGTPFARLARAASADRLRMALGGSPRGVAVGGEPGETAVLVREDAAARERAMLPPEARLDADGQRAELPGGVVWENRIVLRPRLRTPHPLRLAPRVQAPLLVIAGEQDLLCPPGPAAELAERAPLGELREFPLGHFDLYDGASIAAEVEFLGSALSAEEGVNGGGGIRTHETP
ncbi:MAG TPA: alpha/beta hydrolase [Solirubrobacterales bacterium]